MILYNMFVRDLGWRVGKIETTICSGWSRSRLVLALPTRYKRKYSTEHQS